MRGERIKSIELKAGYWKRGVAVTHGTNFSFMELEFDGHVIRVSRGDARRLQRWIDRALAKGRL